MSDFYPQQPFHERHEFPGALSNGKESANNLHFILQYSLIKGGKIKGKIFGDQNDYEKLEKVFKNSGPYYILTSELDESQNQITSNKVIIHTICAPGWPDEFSKLNSEIADIEFIDITITNMSMSDRQSRKSLVFDVAGSSDPWNLGYSRTRSYTGEVEQTDIVNQEIELDENLPFKILISPHYFYNNGELDVLNNLKVVDNPFMIHDKAKRFSMDTNILTFVLEKKGIANGLSDTEFIEIGRQVVNDILILLSFVSMRRNTWYSYHLFSSFKDTKYVKSTREYSSENNQEEDYIIRRYKFRDFLYSGFSKYRSLREQNFNLINPILDLLLSMEAPYIEQQFTAAFLALEKLKDLYVKTNRDIQVNLSSGQFRRLSKNIKNVIQNEVSNDKVVKRIYDKIPELNRPAIKFVLKKIMTKYEVQWGDLYPEGLDEFPFIKTRDKFFHTVEVDFDNEENFNLIQKELWRIRAIVSRIILKMLGWDSLENCPKHHIQKWLTTCH